MGIGLKTHKLLWGKAANRCSICRIELVETLIFTDNSRNIGEEAHIIARKKDGPRGDNPLPLNQRDEYDNLILLCRNHHKMIDDNTKEYTIEKLKKIKKTHENWVSQNLNNDEIDISDKIIVAHYIDTWSQIMELDNWKNNFSSFIMSYNNSIRKEYFDKFNEVQNFIKSRVWPEGFDGIERAMNNFNSILYDLIIVFNSYRTEWYDEYHTEKFHKIKGNSYWDIYPYWEYHTALVSDLGLELTRASNYLCDEIRKELFSFFRLEEGILLIDHDKLIAAKYKKEEKIGLYPGLKEFVETRSNRDVNFGNGKFPKMPYLR